MEPAQRIQGHQVIQTLDNDIYDSAGSNSSSSYVSSSGIKSVLLNAWNAVKSAVSGMLSSFGLHLSGQQGSDKLGREIVMDMSSRPAQPLPGMDAQLENSIYESGGENTYDSVYAHTGYGRPESLYTSVDDSASVRAPAVPDSPRPSLSEPLYSEITEPLYEVIDEYQTPSPVPDSPRPSLSEPLYSEITEPLYEVIDEYQTPSPAPDSPRPSLSERLYSEITEPLYEVIDEYQTPPPVPDSPRPSLRQTAENALYERSGSR
ncbi:hypothetical protein ACQRI3_001258 [Morganella morganii]